MKRWQGRTSSRIGLPRGIDEDETSDVVEVAWDCESRDYVCLRRALCVNMIPRATPAAAPVIKPRIVTPVMDGVLPTNRKPAPAIHKVQRAMRMFMMSPTARCPLAP
jgi:hypothetical protein